MAGFQVFFRNLPRSSPTPQGLSSSQPHLNLLGGRDGDLRSKSAAQGTFEIIFFIKLESKGMFIRIEIFAFRLKMRMRSHLRQTRIRI